MFERIAYNSEDIKVSVLKILVGSRFSEKKHKLRVVTPFPSPILSPRWTLFRNWKRARDVLSQEMEIRNLNRKRKTKRVSTLELRVNPRSR